MGTEKQSEVGASEWIQPATSPQKCGPRDSPETPDPAGASFVQSTDPAEQQTRTTTPEWDGTDRDMEVQVDLEFLGLPMKHSHCSGVLAALARGPE